MRDKVVVLVAILAFGGLAAHAQCRSGYSMTTGDACPGESVARPGHLALPHAGQGVQRQAASALECRSGYISMDGRSICADEASSRWTPSRLVSLKPLWNGLSWLFGL